MEAAAEAVEAAAEAVEAAAEAVVEAVAVEAVEVDLTTSEQKKMAHFKRTKLFVDPKVQGLLILRVVIYWVACMATLELLRLTWVIATEPDQPTFAAYFLNYDWPAVGGRLLIASIVLVPIIWDMLCFSNRFAGPVYRMRRILREAAQGGKIEPVRLRSDDYWHGLADDLNAAFEQLAPERIDRQEVPAQCDDSASNVLPCREAGSEDVTDALSAVQ